MDNLQVQKIQIVKGIMVETSTSRIQAPNLAEMFVLTCSLIKDITPLENTPLTYVGTMKMGRNTS